MAKLGIIGAGSWGTALAVVLEKNGHDVVIWSAIEAEIQMLQEHHEHKEKLPGIKLADNIRYTVQLQEAVVGMDALVLAVPSMYARQTAGRMAQYVSDGQLIVSVATDDAVADYKTGNSTVSSCCFMRAVPCGGSRAWNAVCACSRCEEKRYSGTCTALFYE